VGFETTAPNNAMAVWQAHREGLKNFSILVSHVLVPPAMKALLSSAKNRVQGYLAAGHVCTVMGWEEYEPIAAQYRVPIVVTGFEPVDILEGVLMAVQQLEKGEARVENQYTRVVRREGNRPAQDLIHRVFEISNRKWRGIGEIPASGLRLRSEFREHDAEAIFAMGDIQVEEPAECISGLVLQGLKKPNECAAFGTKCTPQTPLGATMVSAEGACAAYYAYSRHQFKA
jgi:hydrogenase expression/formation protein HypD